MARFSTWGKYNNTHCIEESIEIGTQSEIRDTNINEIITMVKIICFLNREYFKSYFC